MLRVAFKLAAFAALCACLASGLQAPQASIRAAGPRALPAKKPGGFGAAPKTPKKKQGDEAPKKKPRFENAIEDANMSSEERADKAMDEILYGSGENRKERRNPSKEE